MISFYPNCTLPLAAGNFVAAPDVRGTLNIVWSCGSVPILCCWSILHLNVPPQFSPETKIQNILRKLFLVSQKLKWMIATLLAPEIIMSKAIVDLLSATVFQNLLQELAEEDGVPWSLPHTFFANIGGFAIRFDSSEALDNVRTNDLETSSQPSYPLRPIPPREHNHYHQVDHPLSRDEGEPTQIVAGQAGGEIDGHNRAYGVESNQEVDSPTAAQKMTLSTVESNARRQTNHEARMGSNNSNGALRIQYHRRIESFARLFGQMTWIPHDHHTGMSENIFIKEANNIRRDATLYGSFYLGSVRLQSEVFSI